ncbi:MAG: DUF4062 domain-containing protein [Leptospiraceae bacterium]|nr:DUF4062 domain-containing protein [Leptospiraceae bacterium]
MKTERQQVIKAILEMGHIPVGMEMFSAGDDSQWQLIQRQIDDCDYYVIILAHRYGSMDGTISYTEKEYTYAVEKNVPILGFILDDKARWPKSKMDNDPHKLILLQGFKEKIKKKIIDYWKNSSDLKTKTAIALIKQFSINPRPGWVKSSDAVDSNTLNEISRLSIENSQLRARLAEKSSENEGRAISNLEKTITILKTNRANISFYYKGGYAWENSKEISYERIFLQLSPELMVEKSVMECSRHIGIMFNNTNRDLRNPWPTPSNTIRGIIADFHILGLIEHSLKKHEVSDTNEYWTMSNYGKEAYAYLRRSLLEQGINRSVDTDTPTTPNSVSDASVGGSPTPPSSV